ncbi:MAG TPA: DNA cytosine methyltransferase [Pyrinomonadaceae bacterium]|jgi:DNA (cytosine-5)-methyltransferase 1|nr:DNA cytosine methyltransferase [Pyrinomonadaceae bacterium]
MKQLKARTNGNRNGRRSKKPLLALSFFTGAMGLDLGLEKTGISTILASEIDRVTCETIKANRPGIALIGDIRNFTASSIRAECQLAPETDIDLMFGGPPCQAFSTAGKRKAFEDERGNVFLKFVDLILELQPRYGVIENVRGLLSAPLLHRPHSHRGSEFEPLTSDEKAGGALHYVLNLLRNAGYGVSFNLYNSANFGSPQIRERVVILCSRDGKKLPYLTPTHSDDAKWGLPKWQTLRDALEDLPQEPCDYVRFPEKRLRFYRMLKAGQNWRHLPKDLQQEALGNSFFAGGGKTGFLRRLSWSKPAPTLVTHPAMPATDLAHPEEERPLSVQEYRKIQEFPPSLILAGSIIDQYRQIGNAVPTSLGEAIGRTLLAHDAGKDADNRPGFPYSRYIDTDEESWEREYLSRNAVGKQGLFPFAMAQGNAR